MSDQKSGRERLPFEPRQKKTKNPKQSAISPQKGQKVAGGTPTRKSPFAGIPEAVSQRMIRRMAVFCGIPTALGMASFVMAYWIVSRDWFDLPTIAVGYISLAFFGLGVLGLSYGLFSTSWEEERPGGWWGWQEFKVNFGRTVTAWQSAKKEAGGN